MQRPGARDIMRAMRAGTAWIGLGLACLAGALALPTFAQDRERGFSADERRRLEAGELVVRPVARRRGALRLIGGSSWQVVDQPPEVTWRALCDAAHYDRMLPAAQDTRVVAHRPGQRVVRVEHAVGFVHASYHLRMRYDHERRDISFALDDRRPNDLRAAWGFLAVAPFEDDPARTLVSYGVMADPGGGVLGGIMRGQIHDWMLRVPSTIRAYLHGSGRDRYADR